MGAVLGWIGRRGALFLLLVAGLVAHAYLSDSVRRRGELRDAVDTLERARERFGDESAKAVARSDAAVSASQRGTAARLDTHLRDLRRERAALACSGDLGAAMRGGADAVLANRASCVRRALVDREIAAATTLRGTLDIRRPGEPTADAVRRWTAAMRAAARDNAQARGALARIDGRFLSRWRFGAERRRLIEQATEAAGAFHRAQANARRLLAAQRGLDAAAGTARREVEAAGAALDRFASTKRGEFAGTLPERVRGWAARVGLAAKARQALLALIGIIAAPYLIRTFLFHAVAPAVARRRAIRVGAPHGAPIPPAPRSTTSVSVAIGPGEELLVRQGHLQASGDGASKRTRWLLDLRRPFTGLAAGLVFLTRIRGAGERVTLSAVRDPLAEVAVLTLPEGAACVLRPRALVAVAQPIERPLRIASRWRLRSLHAWATFQLRFLVLHGPARLVVKGARGVRVEPAERGRAFGQEQLVGFSADLAYSVARTETFWPYFFGRQPLFRDQVADGGGVLLVEEAPLAGRRGRAGRGLEGVVDAMLKVVGV